MALRSLNNPIASFIDYLAKTGTDASQLPSGEGLTATGGIISDYTDGSTVYRAHIFTSSGTFDISSIGSFGDNVECLVVAGGGGGGYSQGGGGGAGGLMYNPSQSFAVGSYPIVIGAGGNGSGSATISPSGSNTTLTIPGPTTITATGGGAGAPSVPGAGGAGGSGGGGGGYYPSPFTGPPGPGTQAPSGGFTAYKSDGGVGRSQPAGAYGLGGGGGGANPTGTPGSSVVIPGNAGDGAAGYPSSISGISTHYAAGGGGGGDNRAPAGVNSFGVGGSSIGGPGGSATPSAKGNDGVYSTGSGGGGSSYTGGPTGPGGAGGSGIVVVRYQIGQLTAIAKATGGAISYYNGMTIHTFTSSSSFQVTSGPITCNWLVIGGGGSGGIGAGGGGGAGGYRTSMPEGPGGPSPTSEPTQTIANGTYAITVGAGGVGSTRAPALAVGTAGGFSNIAFPSAIRSEGGGGGGYTGGSAQVGQNGGSGGGGNYPSLAVAVGNRVAGTTTPAPNQGYPGGTTAEPANYGTGGGGGAGGQGGAGTPTAGGPGGVGKTSTITGSPVARAGGGGGAVYLPSTSVGTASAGGGYAAPNSGPAPRSGPTSIMGVENTGGGGGGSTRNDSATYPGSDGLAGNGGSGIVIIAYPS